MDALLQTLLGGLIALGGSAIGPFFQRKHERWKASREDRAFLRDKTELLFDELDALISGSQAAAVAAIAKIQDDAVVARPVPDLGKARTIAAIYFPSTLVLIDKFEAENFASMNLAVTEEEDALTSGSEGLDTLRGLPMVMAVQFQQRASKFVSEMRAHLATNVPKLEWEQR